MTKNLSPAHRRTLGNIIALGGAHTTGNGRGHVGAVRTSTVSALKALGLVELGPRKMMGSYAAETWYATAAGCLAFGAEIATVS